jgi:hypothetical protein
MPTGFAEAKDLTKAEREAVGELIKIALAEEVRLSRKEEVRLRRKPGSQHELAEGAGRKVLPPREWLAEDVGRSVENIDKALAGRFTSVTIALIEKALRREFVAEVKARRGAHVRIGGYERALGRHYEGQYQFVRPAFTDEVAGALYGYRLSMEWNEKHCCLWFQEHERTDDFHNDGPVDVSVHVPFINLLSITGGLRLLILSRDPADSGTLFGTISTTNIPFGAHHLPTVAPVALRRVDSSRDVLNGLIAPKHKHFAELAALLRRAAQDKFARILAF